MTGSCRVVHGTITEQGGNNHDRIEMWIKVQRLRLSRADELPGMCPYGQAFLGRQLSRKVVLWRKEARSLRTM